MYAELLSVIKSQLQLLNKGTGNVSRWCLHYSSIQPQVWIICHLVCSALVSIFQSSGCWWDSLRGAGTVCELRSEFVPSSWWGYWPCLEGARGVSNKSTSSGGSLLVDVAELMAGGLVPFSENIFTQQPSYFGDLDETLPTVLQVLLFCSGPAFHLEMWHSLEGGREGGSEQMWSWASRMYLFQFILSLLLVLQCVRQFLDLYLKLLLDD